MAPGPAQVDLMPMPQAGLILTPRHWYGWEMLPGYAEARHVPYFSPTYLYSLHPQKTGRRTLTLRFLNARYAEGVKDVSLELRILKHASDYLVAEIRDDTSSSSERIGIVSHIEFEWIRQFCDDLWAIRPPSSFGAIEQHSVSHYLDALFGPLE